MHLFDLLDLSALDIRIRVTGEEARLWRPISWCAPTEHMDPRAFLSANALVFTIGMAMNVTDYRIWDAYVERLTSVAVAGLVFGTGSAHSELPDGLIKACEAHALPLFELPPHVPFVLVMRQVEQTLATERYDELRRGWDLADECTRLAAQGSSLLTVLHHLAESIDARVSVIDERDYELAGAGQAASDAPRSTLRLPSGEPHAFRLRVRGIKSDVLLQPLLGPVAAVLAVQISYSLGSRTPLHSREAARFIDALHEGQVSPGVTIEQLATEAGFHPWEAWKTVLICAAEGTSRARLRVFAWQARVHFEEFFQTVSFLEEPTVTTLLMQAPKGDTNFLDQLRALSAAIPELSVSVSEAESLEELPFSLKLARRHLGSPGFALAPAADLTAIIQGFPREGLLAIAAKMLAPLNAIAASMELRETLVSYLRHAANTRAICDELFIHRNTLAYRIRRIEGLLDIDLSDGEVRTTYMVALHIAQET